MILSFPFFTWLYFVIYDFWTKSLVSNIIYKNSRICSCFPERFYWLHNWASSSKNSKAFSISTAARQIRCKPAFFACNLHSFAIFRIVFFCVLFFVLNNVTFTNVTNHNDYHKIRWRDCWGLIKVYLLFSRKKCRAKTRQLSVSSYFLSVLASFYALYDRIEHSQGFFICFIINNPLNSPRIAFYFPEQTLFSQRTKVSSANYTIIKHA